MTFAEILQDVYSRVNQSTTPPTDVVNRIKRFTNKWNRRILTDPRFARMREDLYALTTTSGQAMYGLPPIITRVNAITQRSQQVVLRQRDMRWLRLVDPGLDHHGAPATDFVLLPQQVQVQQQPSDASLVFAKSTSASDVGTVFVEGYTTGGFFRSASATMTGTTAVAVTTAITDWIEISKCYLSTAAVGLVTLHEDSGLGTELAKIGIGQTYARYLGIQFWPTPAGEVYHLDFTRTVEDLVNDTDEPLWPDDFHDILVSGAEHEELRKQDDSRYTAVYADLQRRLNDLNNWLNNPPEYRPSSGRVYHEPSNLGPWYPAGRW